MKNTVFAVVAAAAVDGASASGGFFGPLAGSGGASGAVAPRGSGKASPSEPSSRSRWLGAREAREGVVESLYATTVRGGASGVLHLV